MITLMGPFFLTPTPKMPRSFILGLKEMPVAGSVMAALERLIRNTLRRSDSERILEECNGWMDVLEQDHRTAFSHGSGSYRGSENGSNRETRKGNASDS